MPDKFDEMAREIEEGSHGCDGVYRNECHNYGDDPSRYCSPCQRRATRTDRIAAALRSTDAKAREDCRSIALRLHHEYRQGGHVSEAYMCSLIAAEIGKTAAIREGADACGTCGGSGRTANCDGRHGGCRGPLCFDPCPACQGGDDAE